MIKEFVQKWEQSKHTIKHTYECRHPANYEELVRAVIGIIGGNYGGPSTETLHVIDDGDYQGTQLFIVPEHGYQPSTYWSVQVAYGTCSACDTLERIKSLSWEDPPTKQQTEDYLTLCLHILQNIKEI